MGFQVVAKPSGAACNLRCRYCFYTEKKNLYGGGASYRMSPDVLESFIRQYIHGQDSQEVHFIWQGGEPTLLGLDIFRSAVALQDRYAAGKKVSNSIQTNGTLLTDEWCAFFQDQGFLVGLSIDGPAALHDQYRVTASGQPTFDAVMSGLQLLRKHGVAFNTLTVVSDRNSRKPLEVYRFLKQIADGHMQFIPAVERLADDASRELGLDLGSPPHPGDLPGKPRLTPWSVSPQQLASFYIGIFDEWVRKDVGKVFVQFFEVALGNWLGAGSGLCQFAPKCGMAGALEHNGDLYSCDHYVYPGHKLGNIMETPLSELMQSDKQQRFGNAKLDYLPGYCKSCEVKAACHGDCPKHRFATTPDGEPGLSHLCQGYKPIFTYMAPYLGIMEELIHAGRPVSEIMNIVRQFS